MELFDFTLNMKPDACFSTSSTNAKVGENVVFNGACSQAVYNSNSSSTEIVSYLWDFGDGHIATGQTAEHTYVTPGLIPVKLFIIDRQGGNDFMVKPISVTGE